MITIRPVSDYRDCFTEIKKTVKEGMPVYLTKNSYGTMVVMSLKHYTAFTEDVKAKLDEVNYVAETKLNAKVSCTVNGVFDRVKKRIKSHEKYEMLFLTLFEEVQLFVRTQRHPSTSFDFHFSNEILSV